MGKRSFKIVVYFSILLFCSCDTDNYIDYNVLNSTSSALKITVNHWVFDSTMHLSNDTTFYLPAGEKNTLSIRSVISPSVFDPESGYDTIWHINKLNIYINDTIPAVDSLRCSKYWNYDYISRHHATLTLNVVEDYFR